MTAQVRACTEFCRTRGYTVVKQYVDEARTGTNDDRPAFRAMIRDAKDGGKFDVLVVHKLDRFARDRFDSAYYKRELRRAGVKRESVIEQFGEGPEAELVEEIMEDFAGYFSKNLARETRKGLRENALQARSCGGRPCLGYDLDADGRYIVNEREAAAVCLIFRLYDEGATYSEILTALEPYRTKRGTPFRPTSIHDILRNEKYAGLYVYNKRDYSGEKANAHAFRPAEEWVTVEGGVPAIVDPEIWRRVQARMDGRKHPEERARQKARHDYLLSGLIRCGVCGQAFSGNSLRRKDGRTWAWYECGSRKRKEPCGNIRVPKTEAEREVLDGLREIFGSRREKIIADVLEAVAKRQGDSGERLEGARKRVREIEGAVGNLVAAVERGLGTDELLHKLDDRSKELSAARSDLAEMEETVAPVWTRGQVEKYLDHIERAMADATDPPRVKRLVQRLVKEVRVFPDRLEVEFYVDIMDTGGSPKPMPTVSMTIPLPPGPHRRA